MEGNILRLIAGNVGYSFKLLYQDFLYFLRIIISVLFSPVIS